MLVVSGGLYSDDSNVSKTQAASSDFIGVTQVLTCSVTYLAYPTTLNT